MKHYKVYYNDGVYAETFSFINNVTDKQKAAYIQKIIKQYNQNPNPDYHITPKNIKEA